MLCVLWCVYGVRVLCCALPSFQQRCDVGYGITSSEGCVPCDTTAFVTFTDAGIGIVIVVLIILGYIGAKVRAKL